MNETECNATNGIGKFESHPNFAVAMLLPVLMATISLLPQWWRVEKSTSTLNKVFTFLLVLTQFWSQYKMLQILYTGLVKKDPNWKKDKETFLRNFGTLGRYICNTYHIFTIKIPPS